ncbi:MAG: thioredoxin-dependent thiol peroxidase [Candidatus Azobacteroides sp.]|nr:thioredoxin-dependent thiol peroxidase [Candidatus Azobacteroides sp.]
MLQAGDKAPDFRGENQKGETISLSDFKGKKVILYFYPKDDTPGCTAEACSLNDHNEYFLQKGYVIIGVSPDSVNSHKQFEEKYRLSFHLVSDPEKRIIQEYGAWGEKKNYGKTSMGVLRSTFIISGEGLIEKVFSKVDTQTHAEQIIKELGL